MKKLITLVTISIISLSAFSGTTCSYNVFGEYICTGTGNDFGYRSSTTTNVFGEDIYKDNRGNTAICSTDVFGNYVCN